MGYEFRIQNGKYRPVRLAMREEAPRAAWNDWLKHNPGSRHYFLF